MNKQTAAKTTEPKQRKLIDAPTQETALNRALLHPQQRAIMAMQNTAGNRAVGHLLRTQPAEESTRNSAHIPTIQNSPRRHHAASGGQPTKQVDGAPASVAQTLANPGQPLEPALQQAMEQRFGYDFSRVRVYFGATAEQSAEDINANAYTVGQDIVFGAGRFAPGTPAGQRLIAHELAHVVQQQRGGALHASFHSSGALEQAADHAAMQTSAGQGLVTVTGAADLSLMCKPNQRGGKGAQPDEEQEEEEESSQPLQRQREKARTQQRKQARATAGKEDTQLTQTQAEQELRALEESYRQPGAQKRSLKRKLNDLKRYERLLERAGGTHLAKNKRKGAFDELQRTPSKTVDQPQTKHVAGGPQLPGQELRAGKDAYAQPDYSFDRLHKDGRLERVHVNLKSDKIEMKSAAQARATARSYLAQAIRNSRHLADGESIIISFARTPSKEVQEEMKREFFKQGSPISEVRFGTTTHKRADYKPPPATTAPKAPATKKPKTSTAKALKASPAKTPASKPSKAAAGKTPKPPTAKTPKTPVVNMPATKPSVAVARPVLPETKPAIGKSAATPTHSGQVTAPSAPTKLPARGPTITVRRAGGVAIGGMRGGGMRGAAAEGIGALVEAIAVPIINHYLQEHYAESIAKEARELIAKAIEAYRPKFDALIEARRHEIQLAQAEGREVMIHVAVDTSWQDTDIGRVLMNARVGNYELIFEDGAPPRPHAAPRPGGWAGDIFRDLVGTTLSYETYDIALEGTDPVAKEQRLSRKLIEAKMGRPAVAFEYLIINALENNLPLDQLRAYATYRRNLAEKHPSVGLAMQEIAYWSGIEKLIDGSLEDLIAVAKAKNIPLTNLRSIALYRSKTAAGSSTVANPTDAEYWAEVVRLIDAK